MSDWSKVPSALASSLANNTEIAAVNIEEGTNDSEEAFTAGMTQIRIDTTDGRVVEAMVHQATRSVYPKLG